MSLTGFILGFIFGFLLKRSRFCFAGTIQDVLLEKDPYNLVLLLALISTEAIIYHFMLMFNLLPTISFKYFSLLSTISGGLTFGAGTVLCSGCITGALIKAGDGRITGIISITFFMLGTSIARIGAMKSVTQFLFTKTLIKDELYKIQPSFALIIFGIALIFSYTLMFLHHKNDRSSFSLLKKHSNPLRYTLCERIWDREVTVILSGILMALGFYFSNSTGRNDGFAITAPLSSIFNFLTNSRGSFDWAVMLVLGIVVGSWFTTLISGEFYLVTSSAHSMIKHIIGGLLMGIGAIWAGGCIVSNGLVGTAQLSLRAWLALLFIIIGNWSFSSILVKKY